MINIYSLLYKANPENPYGLDRAEEYIENIGVYEEKVKYFIKKYANPLKSNKINERDKDWDFEIY